MTKDGLFRGVVSATIVENPAATANTASVVGRITGLHPTLFLGIALAYFTNSKKQYTPAGSTFSLFARGRNEQGASVRLSGVAVNGTSGQTAPNGWEGTTTAPELDIQFDVVGVNDATSLGHWELIVTVSPAIPMCERDFQEVSRAVAIEVTKVSL